MELEAESTADPVDVLDAARHARLERSTYGATECGEFNVRFDTIVKVVGGLDTTVAVLCKKAST